MELGPTVYAGITFRDQIVAQWAFFFDVLRIAYQYKPETFQGIQVSSHSPDFWLPAQEIWVMVVSDEASLIKERENLVDLHRITGKKAFLFTGFPAVKTFISNSDGGYIREICNFGIDVVGESHPAKCLPFHGNTLNEKMQYVLGMVTASISNENFRANTVRITDAAFKSNDHFQDKLRPLADFTPRNPSRGT